DQSREPAGCALASRDAQAAAAFHANRAARAVLSGIGPEHGNGVVGGGVRGRRARSGDPRISEARPLVHWKKSLAIFSIPRLVVGGKRRGFCRLPQRVATPGRLPSFEAWWQPYI